MSSGFVSGGTIHEDGSTTSARAESTISGAPASLPVKDKFKDDDSNVEKVEDEAESDVDEWARVQSELETDRERKALLALEQQKSGGEKSLYEILQANKRRFLVPSRPSSELFLP